jgi:hypothetical protein
VRRRARCLENERAALKVASAAGEGDESIPGLDERRFPVRARKKGAPRSDAPLQDG